MSHYTQFFGFRTRPFDPHGMHSPVMGTEPLQKAFDQIRSALERDVPVILLQGLPGVGKTSLARALPKLLAGQRRILTLKRPGLGELEEALHAIDSISDPGDSEPVAPAFVFDDAENASEEFLERLSGVLSDWTESPGLACILIMTQTSLSRSPVRERSATSKSIYNERANRSRICLRTKSCVLFIHVQRECHVKSANCVKAY